MQTVFDEPDPSARIKMKAGFLYYDDARIGLDNQFAGLFSRQDFVTPSFCGTKVLQPHTEQMKKYSDMGYSIRVPQWFNPRVVAGLVAFGRTDTAAAQSRLLQGPNQDNAHTIGLIKSDVDTVVVGTELGMQFSVKDPNRIYVIDSLTTAVL